MFPTNRIELVQDAADATIAEREASEAVGRYLKADGERTQAALDGGAALNRLKHATPHGEFGAVLKRLPISERTARRWMRLDAANFKTAVAGRFGRHHGGGSLLVEPEAGCERCRCGSAVDRSR